MSPIRRRRRRLCLLLFLARKRRPKTTPTPPSLITFCRRFVRRLSLSLSLSLSLTHSLSLSSASSGFISRLLWDDDDASFSQTFFTKKKRREKTKRLSSFYLGFHISFFLSTAIFPSHFFDLKGRPLLFWRFCFGAFVHAFKALNDRLEKQQQQQ